MRLAYLPGYGEVKLRLTSTGTDLENLRSEAEMLTRKVKPLIGEYIYGVGNDPLEVAVGHLLREKRLTIAIAESCTGGYLSHLITSVPGSSEYFSGGIIAYSNEVKINDLGVKEETLARHGAVSEGVISEMAQQVRAKFQTAIGVATSGIAGPGGGTPEKPVGTVWIGCADASQTVVRKLQLSKDRLINIKLSATHALNLVRSSIQNLV